MNIPLSLSEQIMYSTIRIECFHEGGGMSTGTGFFFNFQVGNDIIPAIVTNKHVVNEAGGIRIKFTVADSSGNPINGEHFDCDIHHVQSAIIQHPEHDIDLCIIPIMPIIAEAQAKGIHLFYKNLDKNLIPTSDVLKDELTAIEEITMIGYPNGLWDKVNNLPIIRRGITATHPNFKYNGKEEFVIDAACFPGSSGSPVLIVNENGYRTKNGTTHLGSSRVILLGILYAGPQITATGDIRVRDIPTTSQSIAVTNLMMNLGYVINSKKILDFENIISKILGK